jgi:Fur family transcriptional regulator, peroxide stress response regulator
MIRKGSKQGTAILEELRKVTSHPRGDELHELARRRAPGLSLATVYRNLDRFRRDGQVLEIYCGDFVRYDGNVTPHDHFLCRACRRVWDFGSGREERPERAEGGGLGFQIDGQYTVFHGLCADCQVQPRSTSASGIVSSR